MELSSPRGHASWQAENPRLASDPRWARTCIWKVGCGSQLEVCESDIAAPFSSTKTCEAWCSSPCSELNGEYEQECQGCDNSGAGCNPATFPSSEGTLHVESAPLGDTKQLQSSVL